MDANFRLWTALGAAVVPVLALASMPGSTDLGFEAGRGRHFNICGAPSTFGTYAAYVETRIPPGVRAGVSAEMLVEDPDAQGPVDASYFVTAYAGGDWRWFGFLAGGGIGMTGTRPAFVPQLVLRGGAETGLRGELGVGLPTARYPVAGLLRTGIAWGGGVYELGLGLDALPYLAPGFYGYAGIMVDELVLRVHGHYGPVIPAGDGQGPEYGVYGSMGLHFDVP